MVSRSSPLPLHYQLRQLLERRLRAGEWQEGEMIPPESELIERYGVSRTTVRQALADLVAEGLLYRQQGKGTFVAPARLAQQLDSLLGFTEAFRRQGISPEVHLLAIETCPAPASIAERLQVPEGTASVRVERRIDVAGAPLFWDEHYFSPNVGAVPATADLAELSLVQWLEARGHHLGWAPYTMAARAASETEAAMLDVAPGQPVLVIQRTVMSSQDEPLLYSRAVFRSDRYEFQVILHRRAGG